jgi:hypothetical protein
VVVRDLEQGLGMCRDERVGGSTRGTPMRVWLGRGCGMMGKRKHMLSSTAAFPSRLDSRLNERHCYTHRDFELLQTTSTTTTTHHTSAPPS